MKNLRPKISRC